jgi:uncharacterized protein (TIGR02246 family)
MRFRASLFPAAAIAILVACAKQETPPADSATTAAAAATDPGIVRQAIEAANAKAMDAMTRGDTATFLANYADDAVVMMPGQATLSGRSAISQGFGAMMSQASIANPKFTTNDVLVSGDIAVETGAYEMTITPKGGKAIQDKGKYLTVWKRQADGQWKIIRDINNSDTAPTG